MILKTLGLMVLDGVTFIVLLTAMIVTPAALLIGAIYGCLQLPYEWSHGYVFMTIKWGFVVSLVLLVVTFIVTACGEWYDDAQRRTEKL